MRTIRMSLILFVFCFFTSLQIHAQESPPPPGSHGSDGNQSPGGGAPIDGSPFILPLLAAAYGATKWYRGRNESRV